MDPATDDRPNQPTTGASEIRVSRRIDFPSSVAGFTPPPAKVVMRILPVAGRWVLVALTGPGKPAAVARWLGPYGPRSVQIAAGLSPKVLHATFDELPPAWSSLLAEVAVRYLQVTPDGTASIFVEDSIERVDAMVAAMRVGPASIRIRSTAPGPPEAKLTPRQMEAISLAVALGYYEVPHESSLRDIAERLGMSVGAVSELLRRGEALIITNYVDAKTRSEWKESTTGPL